MRESQGGTRGGPAEPRFNATVRGRVVDARGTPVKGMSVGWMEAGAPRGASGLQEIHPVAKSDGKGRYEANLLPPGPCRMVAGSLHFGIRSLALPEELPSTRVFRLKAGATVEAPNIRLPVDPAVLGSLDVTVVDPGRNPVKSAEVFCSRGSGDSDRKTDARGRVRLKGVNPGEVMVSVSGSANHGTSHLTAWLAPGARKRLTLVLPRSPRYADSRRRFRILCTDDRGTPLPGCRITLFGFRTREGSVEAVTGKGGVAHLTGYVRESHRGSLSGAAWKTGHFHSTFGVDMRDPERVARASVVLRREVCLRFKVVDALTGARIRRTCIEVGPRGAGRVWMGSLLGRIGTDGPTRPEFEWLHLPSHSFPIGRITGRVSSPGYEPQDLSLLLRPRKEPRTLVVRLRPSR